MSKDSNKLPMGLIVVSVGLISFLAGAVLVGLAVGNVGFNGLEDWARFGDSINPLVSFISALIVLAGLIVTAKDFRLARSEFEETTKQLAIANELTENQAAESLGERMSYLALRKVEQNFQVLRDFEFKDAISAGVYSVDAYGNKIESFKFKKYRKLTMLLDLLSYKTVASLKTDAGLGHLNSNSDRTAFYSVFQGEKSVRISWFVDSNNLDSFQSLFTEVNSYIHSRDEYTRLVGVDISDINLKGHEKLISQITDLLFSLCSVPHDFEVDEYEIASGRSGVVKLIPLGQAMEYSDTNWDKLNRLFS